MELTLELSCCKYPFKSELPLFWNDNRQALLAYLGQVHQGVRGFTVDLNGVPIPNVVLRIAGRGVQFRSTTKGEYWRILLPGTYIIQAEHPQYQTTEKKFTITADGPAGPLIYLNIEMVPKEFVSTNNFDLIRRFAQSVPCAVTVKEAMQSISSNQTSGDLLKRSLQEIFVLRSRSSAAEDQETNEYLMHMSQVNLVNSSVVYLRDFVCLPSKQLSTLNLTLPDEPEMSNGLNMLQNALTDSSSAALESSMFTWSILCSNFVFISLLIILG
jgi:hypothetical protein